MATARYYRFGGEPLAYMANWNGLPPAAARRGGRELGAWSHERKLASVPLRPSGPEPLDPGEMPAWQLATAYRANYMVQPVGDDAVNTGIVPPAVVSGPLGLSRNETRAVLIGGAVVAAVIFYRGRKKKRRR